MTSIDIKKNSNKASYPIIKIILKTAAAIFNWYTILLKK